MVNIKNMPLPLKSVWETEKDEELVKLVETNAIIYNDLDSSRKSILLREAKWQEISQTLLKSVEDCKLRWRGLRDAYTRSKRVGVLRNIDQHMFERLRFLDNMESLNLKAEMHEEVLEMDDEDNSESDQVQSQQVITDNQEYYEITVIEGQATPEQPKPMPMKPEPQKRGRRGRKQNMPAPKNITPIKILPKPTVIMNPGPKIVRYIEDPKTPEQRSQVMERLIERVLKENTNDIDVFFRSMAASVKKLQPNLIPKVKMEVCNVIAKYEMQNFDRSGQF